MGEGKGQTRARSQVPLSGELELKALEARARPRGEPQGHDKPGLIPRVPSRLLLLQTEGGAPFSPGGLLRMGAGETDWWSPCSSCIRHTCMREQAATQPRLCADALPPALCWAAVLQSPGLQDRGQRISSQCCAGKDRGRLEGCCPPQSLTRPAGPVQREGESSVLSHFPPTLGYGLLGSGEDSWNGHPATLCGGVQPRSC